MEDTAVVHDTFVIERHYPKPPERVFAALADPALKCRWYADRDDQQADEYVMDFRVGGTERLQYRMGPGTPVAGLLLVHDGSFQDIVPNRRVVTSSTMRIGDKRISVVLVTIELKPTDSGTTLVCTHQAVFLEGADGPDRRKAGWNTLFDRLDKTLT